MAHQGDPDVADKAELVVYDEDGTEVQRTEVPKSAEPLEWAGTQTDGTPFASGLYRFNIESSSNGEVVLDEVAGVYARITEVRSENGESVLILNGGVPVYASGVSALREG